MFVVTVVLAVLLSLTYAASGGQKVAGVTSAMENADHLRVPRGPYKVIGGLELLAVVGLLIGLAVWPLGVAAGAGLALLMAGAVVTHLRAGDGVARFAPALVLGVLALLEAVFRALSA